MLFPLLTNNKFDPYEEEIWDTENEFYVAIDSTNELSGNRVEIIFDGIQTTWFDQLNNSQSRLRENYEKIVPYIFRLVLNKNIYDTIISQLLVSSRQNSRWFRLKINKNNGLKIQQFIDNSEIPVVTNLFLEWIRIINPRDPTARNLNRFFSWDDFPIATQDQLVNALQLHPDYEDIHLNVYKVGQGSLSAVCNESEVPLLYFDLGGGWRFNARTYQRTLRLCWPYINTIVISHWDWDHLETARRNQYTDWTPYHGKNWIVPQQPLTASYARFAAHIAATSTLLIWPNNLRRIITQNLEIIKCRGPHKNDSGLALIVNSLNNRLSPILHPGDASFINIPYRVAQEINGLVATHHGGLFLNNNAPVPHIINGCIAYSYGRNNTYKHPKQAAVNSYLANGWGNLPGNRLNTIIGHIAMMRPNPNIVARKCHNNNCILCNVNYF